MNVLRSTLAVGALLLAGATATGCRDGAPPTAPPEGDRPTVRELVPVGGVDQRILAGRRSPGPFQVLALDAAGAPVPGAVVSFRLEGDATALLSQPRALADSSGVAETFVLEPRSGTAVLTASSGAARATFGVVVERAPGELLFEEGTGASGLPGHPHPDSIVRVRVLDTEGRPLPGVEVWFAGPRALSTFRDTTDAQGVATTVVRQSTLRAGEGRVYAFLLDFPELTTYTSRPVVAAARRVVLVSVDGLRGDAVDRYAPPTLSRLASEGSFTAVARTVVPSLTVPAHLSMLSGVSPDTHGVRGESLAFTAEMAALDPLFRHAGRRGLATRAFMGSEGPLAAFEVALSCRLAFGMDSLTLVESSASSIASASLATLADPDVRMVFVHIPDPDLAGHALGFESDAYRRAVLAADSAVAEIVDEVGPEDLLVVTSDHGGGGAYGPHQHGSSSDDDVLIPLFLWGAHAVPSEPTDASILDVAPTVLWALGFEPPDQYEGRILLEAFR